MISRRAMILCALAAVIVPPQVAVARSAAPDKVARLLFYIGARFPGSDVQLQALSLFCKRHGLLREEEIDDPRSFTRKESMRIARWMVRNLGRKSSRADVRLLAGSIQLCSQRAASERSI